MAGKETRKSTKKAKKTRNFSIENGKMGKHKPWKINWGVEKIFPLTFMNFLIILHAHLYIMLKTKL